MPGTAQEYGTAGDDTLAAEVRVAGEGSFRRESGNGERQGGRRSWLSVGSVELKSAGRTTFAVAAGSAAMFAAGSLAVHEAPFVLAAPITGAFATLATFVSASAALKLSAGGARRKNASQLKLERAANRTKSASLYDPLTAIFHRWYFELRLEEETRRCQRYGQSLSLIALRIERPEQVRPTLEADPLELEVAKLAARTLRAVDIPASLGELEFAFCLPNTDADGARMTARRLREALGSRRHAIGIACYPEHSTDGKRILEYALLDMARPRAETAAPRLRKAGREASSRPPVPLQPSVVMPQIGAVTSPLRPGHAASVQAKVAPGATCSIAYTTPLGSAARNAALTPKTADAEGLVSWTWTIGVKTSPGKGTVAISCNGATAEAEIVIITAKKAQSSEPRLRLLAG